MTTTNLSGRARFTTTLIGIVTLGLATLGGNGVASARGLSTRRGDIIARGQATKVVAVGPIALHTYSQFEGGKLYAAPAVTGTDRDCQDPGPGATPVKADRITTFTVHEGEVACLATTTSRTFELLWHAVGEPAPATTMIARTGQ